ncbi:MAG: DUF177 domain-containing protein [Cyanobacteriota bacterium]|nr:DUF177 domain-containing protein [Cyanobacteriota bacterium]
MLKPIRLDDLQRLPRQTYTQTFQQFIEGFASLIPVTGQVAITHRGNFLQANGQANTIVTLSCHRCLQQFNHRLAIQFEEILWIEDPAAHPLPQELEIAPEDLMERIAPHAEFDLTDWVYQHLYLQLPDHLACRADCPGIPVSASPSPPPQPSVDPRWAALRRLQPFD